MEKALALSTKFFYTILSMGVNNDGLSRSGVDFNSEDIEKQPKTEYFVKTRGRFSLRKVFESINKVPFLKGWRKFVVLAFVLAATIIPIVIINVVNQPTPPKITQEIIPTEIANAVYREAITVSQSTSSSAYFDALAVFDNAIAEYEDENIRIEIKLMKSKFYQLYGANDEAIALLLELKGNERLVDTQRSRVMIRLISVYQINGNVAEADELLVEFNRLFPGGE